jgi:hypothetical protein
MGVRWGRALVPPKDLSDSKSDMSLSCIQTDPNKVGASP